MIRTYCFGIICFLLLLCSGCTVYEDVQILGISDYKIASLKDDKIQLNVALDVKNPNPYKIKIKKTSLDLFVNGSQVGEADMLNQIILKKKSSDSHQIALITDKSVLSKALISSIGALMGKKIDVGIKGKVKAKALGIGKKFDVDFSKKVGLADLNL